MSSLEDRLGRSRMSRIGRGLQLVPQVELAKIDLEDWRGGLRLDDVPENLDARSTSDALDIMIDEHGSLVRMPGISSIENVAPMEPKVLFTHAGLDASTELVMFSSPYIGVKVGDAATVWTDRSLPSGDAWDAAVHGDALIFSNGAVDTYYRTFGSDVVNAMSWGFSETLASFAGRMVAGGGQIGGVSNPLGMKWSGASGLVTDVAGIGSGAELLLADVAEGDRILKILPMSFDMLAIVNRKSVWTGVRTGDPYHPIYFAPAVGQVGTVSKYTVKGGPGFVIFLSDSGVQLFDGSQVHHISQAIDRDLLPISYLMIGKYGAVFSPKEMEYRLFTPQGTWIYSMKEKNWLRSSAKPTRAVTLFNPTTIDTTSDPAGWGLFWNGAWGDNVVFSNTVLGDIIYLQDGQLGRELSDETSNFGTPQTPYWQLPIVPLREYDSLFTLKRMLINYLESGTVEMFRIDERGNELPLGTLQLSSGSHTMRADAHVTGRSVSLRLAIKSGFPQLRRVQLLGEQRERAQP